MKIESRATWSVYEHRGRFSRYLGTFEGSEDAVERNFPGAKIQRDRMAVIVEWKRS